MHQASITTTNSYASVYVYVHVFTHRAGLQQLHFPLNDPEWEHLMELQTDINNRRAYHLRVMRTRERRY